MTNYKGSGEEGSDPKWGDDDAYQITMFTKPQVLPCGANRGKGHYDVYAVLTQDLPSCEEVNFLELYERTAALANYCADGVTCKGDCRRRSGETYRAWSCSPNRETNGATAKCEVVRRVRCGVGFEGLDFPSKSDFEHDYPPPETESVPDDRADELDPRKRSETVLRVHVPGLILKCSSKQNFNTFYYFRAPQCSSGASFDFAPYVESAKDLASQIYWVAKCDPNCSERIDTPWVSWDCYKNPDDGWTGIRVLVAMTISCGKRV